jgi:hypothetical protein
MVDGEGFLGTYGSGAWVSTKRVGHVTYEPITRNSKPQVAFFEHTYVRHPYSGPNESARIAYKMTALSFYTFEVNKELVGHASCECFMILRNDLRKPLNWHLRV